MTEPKITGALRALLNATAVAVRMLDAEMFEKHVFENNREFFLAILSQNIRDAPRIQNLSEDPLSPDDLEMLDQCYADLRTNILRQAGPVPVKPGFSDAE